jgi:hypothetical protein
MASLDDIEPQQPLRMIDLVSEAGVNVGDWNGPRDPQKCYNWAFVNGNQLVVLNLWHDLMRCEKGKITCGFNFTLLANDTTLAPVRRRHAAEAQSAVELAVAENIPIRAIVLKSKQPFEFDTVETRLLDPLAWAVTEYNQNTGDGNLTRGVQPGNILPEVIDNGVQDLYAEPEGAIFRDRALAVRDVIVRDARVRARVLKRSSGKCEYCRKDGFPTSNGRRYVEAHHIIALAQQGRDTDENVIALCPEHHRQAHYGEEETAKALEAEFVRIVQQLNGPPGV